ncbi:sugar ABC transporter permease [Spirochaetia bacterium]|nr:sugar ABC transporter permease [Spirochaetia bacterium]
MFIAPFFLLFIVFQLIPVFWTAYIGFTAWNGLNTPQWIGLDNYRLLIQDYMVKDSLFNTLVYWISGIFIILFLSTLIAFCLHRKGLFFKHFFNTVTFLPYVCASVAMGLIFGMLFDENAGFINEILSALGGGRIPWLTGSKFARLPVILLFNWRSIPWFTIIIYSGLLNISKEYYEAATVDGASEFQQFIKITLPSLKNILFFCSLTITVDTWKMFNESFTLKGPGSSNMSLFQLIYQYGFITFRLGYASSLSVLLIAVLLVISAAQFIIKRRDGEI